MPNAARGMVAGLGFWAMVAGASADPAPTVTLPTLAIDPVPEPSVWKGLYVGSEVFAIAGGGSRGRIGGDVYAGYDRTFADDVVLGVQGETGFAPGWSSRRGFKGFDYGATDLRLGYAMGRLTPFVTAGLVLARPRFGPAEGGVSSESFNMLMNGPGELQAATRVGVGATYAVTSDLSVSLGVSAVNGRGLLLP